MRATSQEDLVVRVLDWVEKNNRNPDETKGKIDKSTDLLSTGVLDSVVFIELIAFIESETGCALDLAEVDPEDFTTAEGLCRFALKATG